MARVAFDIIDQALQIAKARRYTRQALIELNSLLLHIAEAQDFSAARGQWNFTFNTVLTTTGGGNIVTSGPNPLPIDYLRVPTSAGSSGAQRSSKWYLLGVPYDMIEVDLTEFDDQVQQAGLQSYPYIWAKDMSGYQPVIEVTGALTSGNTSVTGVAIIDNFTTPAGVVQASLLSSILSGMSIAGGMGPYSVIPPGTTISSVGGGGTSLTLSAAPTMTLSTATLLIGNPGQGYAYPPPSGAYNAMIRYQRRMPRLTQTQVNNGAYCWFEDDNALVEGLAGLMMRYSDDSRVTEFIGDGLGGQTGRFGRRMAEYAMRADDRGNRAQIVELDRRRFGRGFSKLPNTKQVGW